jgi:uncharacterized protein YegL
MFDLGSVAKRSLHFFILCDVSASMSGAKIQSLNQVAQVLIPMMQQLQREQAQAQIFVRVIEFGAGAEVRDGGRAVKVDEATWSDLEATAPRTDLGAALGVLTRELEPERIGPYQYPPCVVLLSDGMPTDRWVEALNGFNASPYGLREDRTVRVAIAIGKDADHDVLAKFTGRTALVFEAHRASELKEALQWVTVNILATSIRNSGDGLKASASADALADAANQFKAGLGHAPRDPNDLVF